MKRSIFVAIFLVIGFLVLRPLLNKAGLGACELKEDVMLGDYQIRVNSVDNKPTNAVEVNFKLTNLSKEEISMSPRWFVLKDSNGYTYVGQRINIADYSESSVRYDVQFENEFQEDFQKPQYDFSILPEESLDGSVTFYTQKEAMPSTLICNFYDNESVKIDLTAD